MKGRFVFAVREGKTKAEVTKMLVDDFHWDPNGIDIALNPGHIVLSGSFTRAVWAQKGDTLRADFGRLGAVSVQFI